LQLFSSASWIWERRRRREIPTHVRYKKPTGSTQSLSCVLPLTFFMYVQQITPTLLKISLTMTLWKAMLYKPADLKLLYKVLWKKQVGTHVFSLSCK
jgi:hypothetical protein